MQPILQIQKLSVTFTQYSRGIHRRELPVVRELSLSVAPGEIVAVVGASGSGKSLLAHAILGLLPYNSRRKGEILYKGEPLDEKRLQRLRRTEIALVPQGVTYLDPLMKVGPQLCRGRRDRRSKDSARAVLNRYGMGETETLYPFQLSGGMARRVLLASAVMEHPQLIIADEPTPGLDVAAAQRVLSHFQELAEEGAAVLFITHDLELALTVAHRVAVFYAGETIEEAAAECFLKGSLGHPFTQALWRAMPQRGFQALSGAQPYPGEVEQGCPFREQCPHPGPGCEESAIPLTPYGSGAVRCLYPNQGGVTEC